MEIFNLTLKQMLMMFTLIAVGFVLRKKSILPENSGTVMAKLETYIFVPALSLYTQMTHCTINTFKENYSLILYGFVIILIAVLLSYPVSALFIRNSKEDAYKDYQRNIYKYCITFGNFGFMGNFIILGVWGDLFFYKYQMFSFIMSIVCNSWGLYILIPKDRSAGVWANIKKGIFTPPIIALASGVLLGLLGISKYAPEFIYNALNNAGKCQGPVAMVLAGFVIGGYDFKSLVNDKKVYIVSFLRLIVIPAIFMIVMKMCGISKEIMTLTLIAYATPLGLNTIVYPAAYGGDTKTGASMATVSHTLSIITIPVMYLIFIVLL